MNSIPLPADPATRQALCEAIAALEAAQASGSPWAMAEGHLRLARGYRQAGALGFALSLLEQGLALAPGTDQRVELLCERVSMLADHAQQLEELQPGQGRGAREAARDNAFEASQLAARVADREWEVKVLLRVSDTLDRLGDHHDATGLQTRALRLMNGSQAPDVFEMPGLGRLADS